MRAKHLVFCPSCITPLGSSAANAVCPKCGASDSDAVRRRLSGYAFEAYRFGYQYRVGFEAQLEGDEGEIRSHPMLPPPDPAAVAMALSILKSLALQVASAAIIKGAGELWTRLHPEQNIAKKNTARPDVSQLSNYVRDYANGLETVHPKVRAAIQEEIDVDWRTAAQIKALRAAGLMWGESKDDERTQRTRVQVMIQATQKAEEERASVPPVSLKEFRRTEKSVSAAKRKRTRPKPKTAKR